MSEEKQPAPPPLLYSTFHALMAFFCRLGELPSAVIWVEVVAAAGAVALWWQWLSSAWPISLVAGFGLVPFAVGDALILGGLPARRISFGPWKGQFLPLELLRLLAAAAVAVGGLWLPWPWALAVNLAGQALGTALLARGALVEPRRLGLTSLDIRTDRLPPSAAAIRVLHVSDLHLERLSCREDQLLAMISEAKPDLILITGDYANISFHRDPTTHAVIRDLLGRFRAPAGVYAVLGSPTVDLHEIIAPLFEGLPVTLLRNEIQPVEVDGQRLALVGLDCHHDIDYDSTRLATVYQRVATDTPSILLYHSPELMPHAAAAGLDLYLCGHTHGGQVRLPLLGPVITASRLGRRYVMGHYREGRTNLYVSRGVGFEGLSAPRVRLLCPPEVTLITLSPAGH